MSKNFATSKLRILGNKTKAATIALVLTLTMAASLIACVPTVNAVNIPTYAYLTVSPSPIGVGQTVLVTMWLSNVPFGREGIFWKNYSVTITKPDGSTTKIGPFTSDYVGSQYTTYIPDKVGTWYFQFSFPGQTVHGNYYQPSTSSKVVVTVQQEPIAEWPAAELPTDYWARPIESENREWASISGNWLMGKWLMAAYNMTGRFNPYTTAPNTAHIVWTKPTWFGGLVGGELPVGDRGYLRARESWAAFTAPIIMNGRLYYNTHGGKFACVDLRTGEQLWIVNGAIACGQLYYHSTMQQKGVFPYLWNIGSTYKMYDPWTGEWILDIANAQTGPIIFSPKGDMLVYVLNGAQNWLAMWNSTKAINPTGATGWNPPKGATLNWKVGVQWNVTVPDVPGVQGFGMVDNPISRDVLIATTGTIMLETTNETDIGYSTKDGHQLWAQPRAHHTPGATSYAEDGPIGGGVYTQFIKETTAWYGYDLYTGRQIWGPTEPYTNAMGMYRQGGTFIAYDKLYAPGYDGCVHCFDIKTGKQLWEYYAGSSGFETPYGYYTFSGMQYVAIADGKVYANTGKPYENEPFPRGYRLYCLDGEEGTCVWSILGYFTELAIADGYLVGCNMYDGQAYCFGKGKTATTVAAPQTSVTNGSTILIQGTVLDQSPGATGTPAVSDKSMEQWMEYLYMQKPAPTNATGVPVQLSAISPGGTVINIGTVTSDTNGNYAYSWCLPSSMTPGTYMIVATFLGSESYYTSWAETGLSVVTQTPQAAAPAVEAAAPDNTPIFMGMTASIVIAIVIGLVNLYMLRKRK